MTGAACRRGGTLIVLSGPSGAGKTSVYRALLAAHPEVSFSVSCTTRAPRPGERDGVDYHFLDRDAFQERVAAGDLLEYAEVHGNWYGTLRREVDAPLAEGRDVLLDIDVQGARQVRRVAAGTPLAAAATYVFCAPGSLDDLRRRLRARGTDAAAVIARRLQAAEAELAAWRDYDWLIVNEDGRLPQAVAHLEAILLACRCRTAAYRKEPWTP